METCTTLARAVFRGHCARPSARDGCHHREQRSADPRVSAEWAARNAGLRRAAYQTKSMKDPGLAVWPRAQRL